MRLKTFGIGQEIIDEEGHFGPFEQADALAADEMRDAGIATAFKTFCGPWFSIELDPIGPKVKDPIIRNPGLSIFPEFDPTVSLIGFVADLDDQEWQRHSVFPSA